MKIKVVNNNGEVKEVTKAAYEILFKDRGFKPHKPKPKTTGKKTTNSSKKVNKDGTKSSK